MSSITAIDLCRLALPLTTPYALAYGPIQELASVWVRVRLDDAREAWGESTPLPGYCDTTIEAVLATTQTMSAAVLGRGLPAALERARERPGFETTALITALEILEDSGRVSPGSVPLVGLVQEAEGETPAAALVRVRALGHRTFKSKVGTGDPARDLDRVERLQEAMVEGERLRLDANQGLDFATASRLAARLDSARVELLEQPLPVGRLEETARLAQESPVPIMLDEEITDAASLELVLAAGAARLVKLKWMKQGGWAQLEAMTRLARGHGVGVVLGNGVASAVGNRVEAGFWLAHLAREGRAGEMNGFLKVGSDGPPLAWGSGCLSFSDGIMTVHADPSPTLDFSSESVIYHRLLQTP